MPFNLSEPSGYLGFVEQLQDIDDAISGRMEEGLSGPVTVSLWTPSVRANRVAEELAALDLDARRVAAWYSRFPVRAFRRFGRPRYYIEDLFERALPLGGAPFLLPTLFAPDPIRPSEGGLEVVRAQQGGSLDVDLDAVGLVLGLLTDVPTLFMWSRVLMKRLPVRLVWRRDPQEPESERVMEGSHDEGQAEAIEASRITRRVTVRYADGSELIEEDFALPDEAA